MKRYIFFFFSFLLFFNTFIFAQSITWQRTYDGVDHSYDAGLDICKADGGNIYIAGFTTFLPNRHHIYVLKINPFGDTIWTKTINLGTNGGEEANAIVSSGDGGCVLTGDAGFAFAIKLDLNGNIIWNRNYGGFFKQCYDIIKTSDRGYIACGRDAEGINDDAYVLKIDSLGNLQWQKTYYSNYWKNFKCITETNNNDGFILGGFNKNYPSDTGYIFLKINLSSDSLWEKRYKHFNIKTIKQISSGYLISGNYGIAPQKGNNYIGKLNESGDTTFFKALQGTNLKEYFGNLEIINSNRYVIAATRDSIVAWYGHVIVTDSIGNIFAERIYPSFEYMILTSVLPISNGDIVFAGTADFNYNYSRDDIYALRTDSLLNAPPPNGINNGNFNIPQQIKLYQNYPNPFNPNTFFKYDIYKKGNVVISIYDITGKLVSVLVNDFKNEGTYEINLTATDYNLSSGIYFLMLETDTGFFQTKKLIYLK